LLFDNYLCDDKISDFKIKINQINCIYEINLKNTLFKSIIGSFQNTESYWQIKSWKLKISSEDKK
jgi:hypothetical protein